MAAIAANRSRRYYEIDYYDILRRVSKLDEKSADKLLQELQQESQMRTRTSSDQVLQIWLEAAKPGHLKFYEETLRENYLGGGKNTVMHLSPAAAKGLLKSLAKGQLPIRISSPLFKWLPYIKETARSK